MDFPSRWAESRVWHGCQGREGHRVECLGKGQAVSVTMLTNPPGGRAEHIFLRASASRSRMCVFLSTVQLPQRLQSLLTDLVKSCTMRSAKRELPSSRRGRAFSLEASFCTSGCTDSRNEMFTRPGNYS